MAGRIHSERPNPARLPRARDWAPAPFSAREWSAIVGDYRRHFGPIDAETAIAVAAAADHAFRTFGLVEVAVELAGEARGLSARTAWRALRAGRWLLQKLGKKEEHQA